LTERVDARDEVNSYLRDDTDAAVHFDRQVATTADSEGPTRLWRSYYVWTEGGTHGEKWPFGLAFKSIFAHKAWANHERESRPSGARRVEVKQAGKHDVSMVVLDSHL
jgi:hypothetical protein